MSSFKVVDGEVPSWHGICHGWAAAATREKKPGDTARVTLADGRSVDFYNGDLQALISRSYADFGRLDYTFIGGRCDAATVRVDRQGRVIDPVCRDVNPGTFHLVLGETHQGGGTQSFRRLRVPPAQVAELRVG